jgi:hypothetical protein
MARYVEYWGKIISLKYLQAQFVGKWKEREINGEMDRPICGTVLVCEGRL